MIPNPDMSELMAIDGGDLFIYGTYRGTMYSVFEILEDYLGIRFYADDAWGVLHSLWQPSRD